MRDGQWEKSKFEGIELQGKVLGIVGMGRIGLAVAPRRALGMVVLGTTAARSGRRRSCRWLSSMS